METIHIYTDGGCSGNPGPGGWAYIILAGGEKIQGSGPMPDTTNNRMELHAVISALREIHSGGLKEQSLHIHTDSRYVQQGITEWIHQWARNGGQTRAKKPVTHQEGWKELRRLSSPLCIEWLWLQGHAGHEYNEACDRLVQATIRQIT